MDGLVLHGEMVECWSKRWNVFLTKNSAKAWQKLWDFGVQLAIAITSLMTRSMFIMMIDLLKGFPTHY
jgi:ribonuclease HIII